jgi:putative heme-binding domain-containing protein
VWAWVAFGLPIAAADDPPASPEAIGLQKRVPWTTSRFQGSPEPPPPYRIERLYPKLRFRSTTLIDRVPGTSQLLVGEMSGKIHLLPEDRNAAEAAVFLDCGELIERLNANNPSPVELDALYAMTFDPDFERNRYCYVCYVIRPRSSAANQQMEEGSRVSRFRVSRTAPLTADVASEEVIITWLQGGHNGGSLRFGHDGNLYISTGDGSSAFPPDGLKSGQDLSTLLAKILRIDVRRQEQGRLYAIPEDNPFVSLRGARGETWAYGLRNPWKMSFDRLTGDLWVGDVGWELWELVYRVNKGDNYGWSIVEGRQSVHPDGQRGPTPIVPPALEVPHTDGASITGGFVYRGTRFPELQGHYIFGDWETRRIWGAKVMDEGRLDEKFDLIEPGVRIVDFAEDRDGELFLLDHDDGSIFTLERNVVPADERRFPTRLSESGLFSSTGRHLLAPGVLNFSINAEQWSDGAIAERFIGVPGNESIRFRARPAAVTGSMFSRSMDFPIDTVLGKTLSTEWTPGDPQSRRRIETQILHFDGREFQAYTYEWNDDQSDAQLVGRSGKTRSIEVRMSGSNTGKSLKWRFSSRAECIRCHNPWSEYTLAFNVAQLNRPHDFGWTIDNQIRTYRRIGLWSDLSETDSNESPGGSTAPKSPEELPRFTPPFQETADIHARARSYLHVNCAHCHRNGGGGSSYVHMSHDLTLSETKLLGSPPTQGTFGIPDAQVVSPGDPYRSVLYFRMSKIGPGHMPHLGASQVDDRGVALIHDWIRQLPLRWDDSLKLNRLIELDEDVAQEPPADASVKDARERNEERLTLARELLTTPTRAMMLADAVRQKQLRGTVRQVVIDAALVPNIDPAIRDLFEPLVPEDRRTRRLGDDIDPTELFSLAGDANRGKRLFHESSIVLCRNCHRIDGKGTELGPDLDGIGRKYTAEKLLESILQPSAQIDPKYKAWAILLNDGRVISGLQVSRDEREIVLRDSENKEHRVAMSDVDEIFPQTRSLMPESLFRDLTAQQAADLLVYLGTLRAGDPPAQ